jgi:hypothetical protein
LIEEDFIVKLVFDVARRYKASVSKMSDPREDCENMRKRALYDLRLTLAQIEERLLVIEYEKPRRIHDLKEGGPPSRGNGWMLDLIMEEDGIDWLDVEKAQLERKRQFILDRRNSWRAKLIWSFVMPIVVSIITAYAISIWL